MFEFYLCIFNFVIEINFRKRKEDDKTSCKVDFDDDKVDVNADVNIKDEGRDKNVEKDVESENPENLKNPEIGDIELQANKFAEELASYKPDANGLYDIDEKDELPQYAFSPDVEIITDGYEKEVEDKIEGRA